MRANFEAALAETLEHEGGWADDPRDAGGATMKGITIGTFRAYKGRPVTKAELRAISDADLRAIYRRQYWGAVRGDDLPAGLDLVAFDAAVNSGQGRSVRWLQAGVRAPVDGQMGPQTVQAAGRADPVAAIHAACDARLTFLRAAKNTKTGAPLWPTYGKGWTKRVASVRAKALAMAAKPASKSPVMPKPSPTPQPVAGIPPAIFAALLIAAGLFVVAMILGG